MSSTKESSKNTMMMDIDLPFDIAEAILSSIDSSSTLRSLALTCTFWANQIIPRHIQYRTLSFGFGLPNTRTADVWAHLALRKDLAKNIRNVHLINTKPECWRYPTSLVTPIPGDFTSEREAVVKVLKNMGSLQKFTWQTNDFGMSPLDDRDLASVLSRSRSLECLSITSTDDSWIDAGSILSSEGEQHPLFRITDLRSLELKGRFWTFWKQDSLLSSMLSLSPNLQTLTLSFGYESPSFATCFFPHLRKLTLFGDLRGCQVFDAAAIIKFLEKHPTIEQLMYYPIRLPEAKFSPGFLPALKKIVSTHDFTMRILRDTTVCRRTMEAIGQISLGPNTLQDLEMIDGSKLQALHLWKYDNIETVHQVAKLFPKIKFLEMPRFGVPRGEMDELIDDYIHTLSCFTHLEVILFTHIWGNLPVSHDRLPKEAIILKLAQACPNLKGVEHHDLTSSARAYIKIKRDKEVAIHVYVEY